MSFDTLTEGWKTPRPPRRIPDAGVSDHHPPAYFTWRDSRDDPRFCTVFGEFGATITFVSNIPGETQTFR